MNPDSQLTGEPAFYAAAVASLVQFIAAFFVPLPDQAVSGINAVVLALAGVWVAFSTKSTDNGGSIKAALLGFAQAGISLAVTFGWSVTPEKTATLMTLLGFLIAAFVRQTSKPRGVLDLAARP